MGSACLGSGKDSYETDGKCETCDGMGNQQCAKCRGSGEVKRDGKLLPDWVPECISAKMEPCRKCKGTGKRITAKQCTKCRGSGEVKRYGKNERCFLIPDWVPECISAKMEPCRNCKGTGKRITADQCTKCRGSGEVKRHGKNERCFL